MSGAPWRPLREQSLAQYSFEHRSRCAATEGVICTVDGVNAAALSEPVGSLPPYIRNSPRLATCTSSPDRLADERARDATGRALVMAHVIEA